MANFVAPFAGLAALGSVLAISISHDPVRPDPIQTAEEIVQANTGKTWLIGNEITREVCLITKTEKISLRTSKVDVDPTCNSLVNDGLDIQVWQQDEQGNVTLGNEQGFGIAEFTKDAQGNLILIGAGNNRLTLTPIS